MNGGTREVNKLVRLYRRMGWRVEGGGERHWKFYPPDGGGMVVVSGSPSGPRALAHALADLRRAERRSNHGRL